MERGRCKGRVVNRAVALIGVRLHPPYNLKSAFRRTRKEWGHLGAVWFSEQPKLKYPNAPKALRYCSQLDSSVLF
jgi:hypothetical protein